MSHKKDLPATPSRNIRQIFINCLDLLRRCPYKLKPALKLPAVRHLLKISAQFLFFRPLIIWWRRKVSISSIGNEPKERHRPALKTWSTKSMEASFKATQQQPTTIRHDCGHYKSLPVS